MLCSDCIFFVCFIESVQPFLITHNPQQAAGFDVPAVQSLPLSFLQTPGSLPRQHLAVNTLLLLHEPSRLLLLRLSSQPAAVHFRRCRSFDVPDVHAAFVFAASRHCACLSFISNTNKNVHSEVLDKVVILKTLPSTALWCFRTFARHHLSVRTFWAVLLTPSFIFFLCQFHHHTYQCSSNSGDLQSRTTCMQSFINL